MQGKLLAVVLGVAGLAGAARAEEPGMYLDLYGGLSFINDNALDTSLGEGAPVDQTFFLDYDEGFVGGLRLGYRYNAHVRVDLEFAHRRSSLGELTSPGNIITPGYSFAITTQALMVNGYYDLAPMGDWTPYLGAGVGRARVTTAGAITPGDPGFTYDATQSAFAAQLRLGATMALSETMDMGVEYTHFRAFGLDENVSADYYDTLQEDYRSDSVSVLLRMKF